MLGRAAGRGRRGLKACTPAASPTTAHRSAGRRVRPWTPTRYGSGACGSACRGRRRTTSCWSGPKPRRWPPDRDTGRAGGVCGAGRVAGIAEKPMSLHRATTVEVLDAVAEAGCGCASVHRRFDRTGCRWRRGCRAGRDHPISHVAAGHDPARRSRSLRAAAGSSPTMPCPIWTCPLAGGRGCRGVGARGGERPGVRRGRDIGTAVVVLRFASERSA